MNIIFWILVTGGIVAAWFLTSWAFPILGGALKGLYRTAANNVNLSDEEDNENE